MGIKPSILGNLIALGDIKTPTSQFIVFNMHLAITPLSDHAFLTDRKVGMADTDTMQA